MKRAALLGPGIAAAIAVLSLVGWLSGRLALAGGAGAWVPTAPVTALGLLLLAAASAGLTAGRAARRASSGLVAALTGAALAAMVEGMGGPGVGISTFLAPALPAAGAVPLGEMSPVTAGLLALVALALLAREAGARRRRLLDVSGVLAGVAAAGGMAHALAYLAGAPLLYAAAIVPVALPTALAVVALGGGLLAGERAGARPPHSFVPTAAVVVTGTVAAAVLFWSVATTERERARLALSHSAAAIGQTVERVLAGEVAAVGRVALLLSVAGDGESGAFGAFAEAAIAESRSLAALAWVARGPGGGSAPFVLRGGAPAGAFAPPGAALEARPEVAAALAALPAGAAPLAVAGAPWAGGGDGAGATVLAPVQGAAGVPGRPTSRPGEAVLGVLSLDRLLAAALPSADAGRARVELRVGDALAATGAPVEAPFARWESAFELAGARWELSVAPQPGHPAAPHAWPARAALAAMLAVTVIVATILAGRARREADREAMVRRLAESETRYRALFESSGDAILLLRDGVFVDCNARTLEILGCRRDDVIGRSPADFSPETQRDAAPSRQVAEAHLRAVVAGGILTFEWLHARADGSLFDAEVRLRCVDLPGGRFVQAVLRDITEQRCLRLLQAAISEISRVASTAATLDELYASIHVAIGSLIEARNLYIALYDRATGLLSFPYFVDEVDSRPGPIPPGRGLTGYVMRTGKALLVNPEVLAALEAAGEVESLGAASVDWVGVPLKIEDEAIGVLAVQSYSRKVHYGAVETDILTYVSTQVAQAISHKRAELAMRRLAIAVEHAAEMIVITDPAGAIEYVNPAFERVTGYSRDEAIGSSTRILRSGEQSDAFYRLLWETVREGGSWSGRLVNRRKDGTRYEEEMSIAPVRDEQGEIVNYVAVKRDVTREVALQRQLHESQRMEAIGRLAGGVAHDFNNLLQAMLSHIQLLGGRSLDAARLAGIRAELEEQVRRGAALTRQLLVFSRRDSARAERLDVNEVITHESRMLRRLVRESIAITPALAAEPLPVEADRGQLEQVMMNLVVNASDAMPDGGTITLRTGCEDGSVWLEVEDTGSGIPDEILPRIFEPFFTTKPREKGTGLGLAVVHGIVTALGGSVSARSKVGAGTSVRVVLRRADAAAPEPAPPPPPADDLPLGRGERLLVVEDEEAARDGLQRALTMLGYEVVAAGSAEEALALPPIPGFDVLLTDVVLPGMQGGELMRRLRERWGALETIVMSGYADDDEVRSRIGHGTVRFLQKPFSIVALARELRALLAGRADPRGGASA